MWRYFYCFKDADEYADFYDSVSMYSDADDVFDNNYTQQLNDLISKQEQLLNEFDINQPLPPIPSEAPPIYVNALQSNHRSAPPPVAPRPPPKPKAAKPSSTDRSLVRQDGVDSHFVLVEGHYSIPEVDQNSNIPDNSNHNVRHESIYVTMTKAENIVTDHGNKTKPDNHLQTPTAQLLHAQDKTETTVQLRKNLRAERKLQLVTIKRKNSALNALSKQFVFFKHFLSTFKM